MKTRLWIILMFVVITLLPLPALALAQDTSGDRCVIIQGPARTESGFIIGPVVTVGGRHNHQITGPEIHFSSDTEAGSGPIIMLPAVQSPPDPCSF